MHIMYVLLPKIDDQTKYFFFFGFLFDICPGIFIYWTPTLRWHVEENCSNLMLNNFKLRHKKVDLISDKRLAEWNR